MTILLAVVVACQNPLLVDIAETVEEVVTPPAVTAIFPSQSAIDVPVNTEVISVSFNKAIDESSVKSASFYVALAGGGVTSQIAGTTDLSFSILCHHAERKHAA